MRERKTLQRSAIAWEALESRRLMDAAPAPWGDTAKLIRQDVAAATYPTITGANQSVAVIDTGIDYMQPYLGGGLGKGFKVVGGWDFVDNDADPMDTYGHGTNVAGVIAASGFDYNGAHYQGIAASANLVAIRVDGADDPVPAERIQAALQWVIDHQAAFNIVAVNISFGEGHYSGAQYSLYSTELAALKSKGIFVAAASGNDGIGEMPGIEYPAADPSVFSVGAVDSFDRIAEYSSRGSNLNFLAPGDSIPTTSPGPNDFEVVSGTSFATPMVAGAVALLKQANPDLQVKDLRSLLKIAAVNNLDGDNEFGSVTHLTFPRLDLANAIALAQSWQRGPLAASGELASSTASSIAYDGDGVLHVAYYDPEAKTLAYCVRLSSGLLSTPHVIDLSGDDVGQYISLSVDHQGRPGIAYFDGSQGDLRYAHFNGATWDTQTIESRGSVGLYPSLAYDPVNHPIISYYNKTRGNLRIAEFDGSAWSLMYLDSAGDVGRWSSMAIDATGDIAIAYEHTGLGMLKVARYRDGKWTLEAADTRSRGIGFVSLAFNKQNEPGISYYDAGPANLKYAEFDGTQWTTQSLASRGAQGLYTQLFFDRMGRPSIFYYNRRSDMLMRVSRDGELNWNASVLQPGGGRFISLALDDNDGVTYTWYRTEDGKLVFGKADAPVTPLGFSVV